ncbi:DUF4136 domain-containing protein [Atopomonas sediminilitoris]|uniref:DUF4136 domain-containing protein n=1 Tax=Atopomonas sediminilitoris TaxID=2919919 RepID=UPI001F4EE104|nr:DUF4136 domain-containing protein [Atopomonas sediminilitoris]MCJ8170131.1 DUF4136 domain-containing protein [Atopomonas sediminilitoris]
MRRLILSVLFSLVALAGCSSDPVPTDALMPSLLGPERWHDLRTFSLSPLRTKGHRLDLEPKVNQALRQALEAKGYRYQADDADIRVLYAFGLSSQAGINQRPVITSQGTYTRTEIIQEEQVRLALRLLDRSDNILLDVAGSRTLQHPDLSQKAFDQAATRLFNEVPRATP